MQTIESNEPNASSTALIEIFVIYLAQYTSVITDLTNLRVGLNGFFAILIDD